MGSLINLMVKLNAPLVVFQGVPLYRHIADLAGNKKVILPVPCFNVINGGSHAGNKLAMQEFMLLPTGGSTGRDGWDCLGDGVDGHVCGDDCMYKIKIKMLFSIGITFVNITLNHQLNHECML